MRIIALSDIHSNHAALEAIAERINFYKPDLVALLGDYVSDCPYPQKTLQLLRQILTQYNCKIIRGNREQYFIDYKNSGENWQYGRRSGSLLYTYDNLSVEDIEFFSQIPETAEIDSEYGKILLCHGAPDNMRLVIKPESKEFYRTMKNLDARAVLCGHCHISFIDKAYDKIMVNCGSAGVPVSTTSSEFALIDITKDSFKGQIIRVPYDKNAILAEFVPSGLIDKGATWAKTIIANIFTGERYNQRCVHRVKALAKEKGLDFDDEELWLIAAKEIGLEKIVREAIGVG